VPVLRTTKLSKLGEEVTETLEVIRCNGRVIQTVPGKVLLPGL
jgi:hypothetical protein